MRILLYKHLALLLAHVKLTAIRNELSEFGMMLAQDLIEGIAIQGVDVSAWLTAPKKSCARMS